MESSHSLEMIKIKESNDAWPFAGKIIAYTTNSSYLGTYVGLVINNKNEIKYGYVEDKPTHLIGQPAAFRIHQFKRAYETAEGCKALMDQILRERNFALAMRYANNDELTFIAEAIKNGKAYLEDFILIWSVEQKDILKLLQNQLKNRIS